MSCQPAFEGVYLPINRRVNFIFTTMTKIVFNLCKLAILIMVGVSIW